MGPVKLVALLMLVSLTFGAGLQVDRPPRRHSQERAVVLGALMANFLIVPVLGVLLVKAVRLA